MLVTEIVAIVVTIGVLIIAIVRVMKIEAIVMPVVNMAISNAIVAIGM